MHFFVVTLTLGVLLSGCVVADGRSDVSTTDEPEAVSSDESSELGSFSADVLFDGVARLDSEFEQRLGFGPMGAPMRETSALLPLELVAPERCQELASVLWAYGRPDSSESGFGQAIFQEGRWGYISGFRTTPAYRQSLAESLESCTEFSSTWEADMVYNGEVRYETSDYRITKVDAQDPDHIVLSLEAVIARQFPDVHEAGDCLQYFGPACIDTFGASYRLHMVSSEEYSLTFMVEAWAGLGLDAPSIGVSLADMGAIDEVARDFLSENS